jgi:cytochrome c-type biogenesis protein CcsB
MKWITWIVLVALGSCGMARGAEDFANKVDLTPLQTVAVQHAQTMKTLDSYARQEITAITGHSSLDGHSSLYSLLDMAFRPEKYTNRNIIKIKNVPVRQEFLSMTSLPMDERERIVHSGLISWALFRTPEVQDLLKNAMAAENRKVDAIGQLQQSAMTLGQIVMGGGGFPTAAVVPPATNDPQDLWHTLTDIQGNVPEVVEYMKSQGMAAPPALPNYASREKIFHDLLMAEGTLASAWQKEDADGVNKAATDLAELLPQVNAEVYPSSAKRSVEVIYNKLAKMTIPGMIFYFSAFVCFLISSRAGVNSVRLWALRLFVFAFLIHTTGIGIRWWLVGSIPIKNMFESVMFSSWFGALTGVALELGIVQTIAQKLFGIRSRAGAGRGLFGAAASFVGCLAMIALFTVPLVIRDIGQEIGQVNGVLMSYWLYIHVTMVTASYSLIGMGFLLSVWWLVKYYSAHGTLMRVSGAQLSADAGRKFEMSGGDVVGGAISLNLTQTIARMLFIPIAVAEPATSKRAKVGTDVALKTQQSLATLDLCNLVVLQLAFWVLGAGIICGAIWADQSWGRPWGWDPKETFALVTWIVYLIVVHVRVATEDKAWWTAVLSVIGFFVMLFNWIGVNFFLVGLHSYA